MERASALGVAWQLPNEGRKETTSNTRLGHYLERRYEMYILLLLPCVVSEHSIDVRHVLGGDPILKRLQRAVRSKPVEGYDPGLFGLQPLEPAGEAAGFHLIEILCLPLSSRKYLLTLVRPESTRSSVRP